MTDELRELATFAYECGLVSSVGDVRHGVTIRDGLTRGRELAVELKQANVELDQLRRQVDIMARYLQRTAYEQRDALTADLVEQPGTVAAGDLDAQYRRDLLMGDS